jgi:hypothetical protein
VLVISKLGAKMNWLMRHKDEILKLTIVSVISLIIFNILMAMFNWTVLNVPVLVTDGGSSLSKWWFLYAEWGQETVTFEQTKVQIMGGFIALLSAVIQLFFWGVNRKYTHNK